MLPKIQQKCEKTMHPNDGVEKSQSQIFSMDSRYEVYKLIIICFSRVSKYKLTNWMGKLYYDVAQLGFHVPISVDAKKKQKYTIQRMLINSSKRYNEFSFL
jgi:hypothetical protein